MNSKSSKCCICNGSLDFTNTILMNGKKNGKRTCFLLLPCRECGALHFLESREPVLSEQHKVAFLSSDNEVYFEEINFQINPKWMIR